MFFHHFLKFFHFWSIHVQLEECRSSLVIDFIGFSRQACSEALANAANAAAASEGGEDMLEKSWSLGDSQGRVVQEMEKFHFFLWFPRVPLRFPRVPLKFP